MSSALQSHTAQPTASLSSWRGGFGRSGAGARLPSSDSIDALLTRPAALSPSPVLPMRAAGHLLAN